jgi:hypothetical protein
VTRGGARLGERGWGAEDAPAAEGTLSVVRGVDQRPQLGLGDAHGDCASVETDARDLAVALIDKKKSVRPISEKCLSLTS